MESQARNNFSECNFALVKMSWYSGLVAKMAVASANAPVKSLRLSMHIGQQAVMARAERGIGNRNI